MRESKNTSGFLMLDNTTFDRVLPAISRAEKLVLLFIYRQTIGWKQEYDKIPLAKMLKWSGYKNKHSITDAIKRLEARNLITVIRQARKASRYKINLDVIYGYGEEKKP